MTRVVAKVKPDVLHWARKSAGLSLSEAAAAMAKSEDVLTDWENGSIAPTIPQLRKIAQVYKRPLAVFYLQEVPPDFQVISDFRRLPGTAPRHFSPILTQEIRMANQRRELALELLSELDEKPEPFGLSFGIDIDSEAAAQMVRDVLAKGIDTAHIYGVDATGRKGLNWWRERIENVGVLVFQAARIPSEEASGFALAYDVLPAIVINRKDAPVRRLFSLLHEFAHLALRKSGVSDLEVDAPRPPEDSAVEVFCNQVAAAVLMPAPAFLAEPIVVAHGAGMTWTEDEIAPLAARFNVSREAIVRRLFALRRTTQDFYRNEREKYADEFRQREILVRPAASRRPIPRNMPQETLSNFGRPFVEMVLGNYYQDRLTLSEVSGYLGLRVKHVTTLESKLRER